MACSGVVLSLFSLALRDDKNHAVAVLFQNLCIQIQAQNDNFPNCLVRTWFRLADMLKYYKEERFSFVYVQSGKLTIIFDSDVNPHPHLVTIFDHVV